MRLPLMYLEIQYTTETTPFPPQKPRWPKALYKLPFAVTFGSLLGGPALPYHSPPPWQQLSSSLEGAGGRKLVFPALL